MMSAGDHGSEAGEELRLGQLACSRLCHDLAGPAGAIGTGLELLADDPTDTDTRSLLNLSSARLARCLEFYRMAFGMPAGRFETDLDEARALTADYLDGGKVTLEWQRDFSGCVVPADVARLALCAVLIAAGSLPRGGHLRVQPERVGDGWSMTLDAEGRGASLPAGVAEALKAETPVDMLTARSIHAAFAVRLARATNAALRVETPSPDVVRVAIHPSRADVTATASIL